MVAFDWLKENVGVLVRLKGSQVIRKLWVIIVMMTVNGGNVGLRELLDLFSGGPFMVLRNLFPC